MDLTEKAAYIKGLAEGLELDTDKKEARILNELLDLVSEMASDVEDIGADLVDLYDAFEELDHDLGMVEEELYGDMENLFSDDVYEIVCPNCQETVVLDEEMLIGGDVICPGCGEKIEIEIDTCDCGHSHDV